MRTAQKRITCPSCRSNKLRDFYGVRQIPVHSCLLMNSAEDACSYPVGDLSLAICEACGFISNTAWEKNFQAYDETYEETQHFSDTFHRFASGLARRWIDQYNIRGKVILEIGCGKAEFLALLCELGGNEGIGVDPSVNPDRLPQNIREQIRFIPEYYSESHANLAADVICCRHTLEHVFDTRHFLQTLRRSVAREDAVVLFELPDTRRVLREVAFWDIYYEHCSYFTAGSLGRLFRSCGFDVIDLHRVYGEQYLVLVARPIEHPTSARFEIEHDLDETLTDVARFEETYVSRIQHWRARLADLATAGKRVVAWGAGSKCVAFCTTLGLTDELAYAVDVNPRKQGKFLPGTGHRVVSPTLLANEPPDVILVMNRLYCDEISETLRQINVSAELVPLSPTAQLAAERR